MTQPLIAVLRAADFAARWHTNQRRKGAAAEPYINHLLEVAHTVAGATEGRDTDLIIAALLHDAIEDQGVSRTRISKMFGEDVALLVEEVTDDKSLEKAERKRRQIQKAPGKSPRAKILNLADKISNLSALAECPPPDWSLERRREYIQWARDVAAGLTGVSASLEKMFEIAAEKADRSTG